MSKGNFFFIYPDSSFNEITLKNLNPFSESDFEHLKTTLAKNNLEIIQSYLRNDSVNFFSQDEFHFHDEQTEFAGLNINFLESEEAIEKKSSEIKMNFFINPFGFGLNKDFIEKIFSLLEIDDDIAIYSMHEKYITFLAFNNYDKIFSDLFHINSNEKKMHKNFLSLEKLFYRLDGYELINDFSALKKLYDFLSKKESIPYCSQNMHEEFTHIFIEYKEQIN